tara:strand:+ start:1904 stop:2539 length:636 start_codon:yes stop_codon:yes gene_type:complete
MEYVEVTPKMIVAAYADSNRVGAVKDSILQGAGNVAGSLGEQAVCMALNAEPVNTASYDVIWNGLRVEVKTKRRTQKPILSYPASIAATSSHQKYGCDLYIFTTVLYPDGLKDAPSRVYFCGQVSPAVFWEKAQLIRKGEAESYNGFRAHADMYNMPYKECDPIYIMDEWVPVPKKIGIPDSPLVKSAIAMGATIVSITDDPEMPIQLELL